MPETRSPKACLLWILLLLAAPPCPAAVFVVDSVGVEPDDNLGDNLCHTAANTCTLPAAISQSNATLGTDTIQFAIPGAGVHTIAPLSALPPLLEAATVDGTTQPGYGGSPLIELDGTAVAAGDGLLVSTTPTGGGSVTIRGLTINRFPGSGILLQSGAFHVIQGNYIGTDSAGAAAAGNGFRGVDILVAASDVTVRGACPSLFADWIEDLFNRAITGGCGSGNYCPGNSATRGQMATFVSKTFNLQ